MNQAVFYVVQMDLCVSQSMDHLNIKSTNREERKQL